MPFPPPESMAAKFMTVMAASHWMALVRVPLAIPHLATVEKRVILRSYLITATIRGIEYPPALKTAM